ncbi:MAG: CopG family transcriptional regulator [Acidobacteriia bacterium]|nr:CopG family transcriptional regulator [Terriglobia bacterium]MYG03150.1 CopG family transcriptional regulator [Terriglobia bacterium]MYK12205.1 CopG family transcriptional regulator [Terriglobia bacterium]
MKPIAYRLPEEASKRLQHLAELTGCSNISSMIDAITEHLDDLEDSYLAERRLIDSRTGKSPEAPLEDVMKRYGTQG